MLSLIYMYKYDKEYQTAKEKSLFWDALFCWGVAQLGVGLMLMPKTCDSGAYLKCFPSSHLAPACMSSSLNWADSGIN